METVLEHPLEPEIAQPPPRHARLPGRRVFLLTVAFLLLGLFILGSGRALWEAGKLAWLAGRGTTVTGHIVAIHREPSLNKDMAPRPVAVRYSVDFPRRRQDERGVHRSGWIGWGQSEKGLPQLGQPLPFRHARWFGEDYGYPWQPVPSGRLASLVLSGGLVMLVSLLLLSRLTQWLKNHLSLLREGVATVGTIIHKRAAAEDIVRYFVSYGYAAAPGEGCEREEQVSQEQWQQFEVGQPVTVLFNPAHPEQAGLYALMRQ